MGETYLPMPLGVKRNPNKLPEDFFSFRSVCLLAFAPPVHPVGFLPLPRQPVWRARLLRLRRGGGPPPPGRPAENLLKQVAGKERIVPVPASECLFPRRRLPVPRAEVRSSGPCGRETLPRAALVPNAVHHRVPRLRRRGDVGAALVDDAATRALLGRRRVRSHLVACRAVHGGRRGLLRGRLPRRRA